MYVTRDLNDRDIMLFAFQSVRLHKFEIVLTKKEKQNHQLSQQRTLIYHRFSILSIKSNNNEQQNSIHSFVHSSCRIITTRTIL